MCARMKALDLIVLAVSGSDSRVMLACAKAKVGIVVNWTKVGEVESVEVNGLERAGSKLRHRVGESNGIACDRAHHGAASQAARIASSPTSARR